VVRARVFNRPGTALDLAGITEFRDLRLCLFDAQGEGSSKDAEKQPGTIGFFSFFLIGKMHSQGSPNLSKTENARPQGKRIGKIPLGLGDLRVDKHCVERGCKNGRVGGGLK